MVKRLRLGRMAASAALVSLGLMAGTPTASAANGPEPAAIAARLQGSWTNLAQIAGAYGTGGTDASVDARFMEMAVVEAPAFGDHVVYLQWRAPDAEGRVTRQRLWAFDRDAEGRTIMRFFALLDANALIDAHRTAPERFARLSPADVTGYPEGCTLPFTEIAGAYVGSIPESCVITAQRSGRTMRIEAHIRVEPRRFVYDERGIMGDGSIVFDVPQRLERFEADRLPEPEDDQLPATGP